MKGSTSKYRTRSGEQRWQARWDLPPAGDGSRKQRRKRGFTTKREADAFLAEIMHEQTNLGRVSVRSDVTLGEYAAEWLAGRRDLRATSRDNLRVNIEVHITPRLGGLRVQDVTAEHVARLYRSVAKHGKRAGSCRTAGVTCREHGCAPDEHDGLAAKSVGHVHGALRAVLAQAVEDGLLASNPADSKRARQARPRKSSSGTSAIDPEQVWTAEQARAFLATVDDDVDATLYGLVLGTGLRRGEALGLHWCDIDLDAGTVRVRRSVTEVRGQVEVTEGKTGSARREVGIGPALVATLRRWKAAQAAQRLAAGPDRVNGPEVFTDDHGAPLVPSTCSRRFTRAVDDVDVPTITLHDLRHTHASLLLSDGVSIAAVAARLGHADPSITLSVYAHAMPADDQRATAAAERLLYG